MKVSDFHFDLPEELIARYPLEQRSASRLLCLDIGSGDRSHRRFTDIVDLFEAGDLLVFNDTRVIPARLFGTKSTGGKVEILVERLQGERGALVHLRASKPPRPDHCITLESGDILRVIGREADLYRVELDSGQSLLDVLHQAGHMPLPPYMERDDESLDRDRYQTVYARKDGAVAAPTAGLHFDQPLLAALRKKGVKQTFVTLHVGAGTFQPVRVDNVTEHRMHSEYLEVGQDAVDAVAQARAAGRRVIAVGTTSVRALESAAADGQLRPYQGDTDIFIYPGYEFRCIDELITNFHLPESTLLMLVSALAGQSAILDAYRDAVGRHYRFFSYGDAMFIHRRGALDAASSDNSGVGDNEA